MKAPLAKGFYLLMALAALAPGVALGAPAAGEWPRAPSIHPAVVRIVAPGKGSVSYGSGTLVHVDEQMGVVLTNWHVINEATAPISVHFPDGFYSLGKVQKADRDWDLAAIIIKRPNVAPVPLAGTPPHPGEVLTIAGYGQGEYRAAAGRCTQYVAPGTSFPFEMVEVAVSARQGDSGGPIFNSRGELAGVLFGEGHGRTSGSYCGRVKWFLAGVVPPIDSSNRFLASAPQPPPAQADNQSLMADASSTPAAAKPVQFNPDPSPARPAAVRPPLVETRSAEPVFIGWEDLAGETLADQIRSVLAAVGVLAIILHTLRWISLERETAT